MSWSEKSAAGHDPALAQDRRSIMSYAIIGFGKIGHALAKAFARKGIEVYVATTRDPESAGHPVSPNKSSHRS
jgi:phosphoglycerate dehydrogenase-like enzyme